MNSDIKQRIEQINRGEVPGGYKKTAVGIVPQEWEYKKLKNIGKFSKGKGLPGSEMKATGVPCIGYGDIYTKYNFKFDKAQNFVSQEVANNSLKCPKNSLFFTCSGETAIEIGKCVCYTGDEDIYVGGDIAVLSANAEVVPLFVGYQQNIPSLIKQKARLGQGHSVVHIYADSLEKLGVAYPKNTYEQQRIADILSKWDEAIELQEKLIEKLELQKKALMQRLLTPKEDWKKVKLGDLAFMQSGGTPKSTVGKYYNGNIVWVSINDISSCGKYLSDSERKITVEGLNNSSARLFPKGTVLYAMYASIGKCCIALSECSTSQAILGITTNENLNSEYLYYFLLHNQEKIVTQGQKGTQSNLNKEMVQNIKVDIPQTINQQITIVKILNSVDRYIDSQSEKLKVLKQQQKTMQQLLLTGIVRV